MEAVAAAPLTLENNRVCVRVLVNSSSIEVFGNERFVAITSQVFPEPGSTGVALFAGDGDVQ